MILTTIELYWLKKSKDIAVNIYDLKEGDIVEVVRPYSDRRVEFTVITNIIDDVLFLFNENNGKGIHLFYDDPEDMWYAKANFDIDTDKVEV